MKAWLRTLTRIVAARSVAARYALMSVLVAGCTDPVAKGDVADSASNAAVSAGVASSTAARARSGDAKRGLALMNAFRDSLPSHSGNTLRCTSCHLDNGLRATAMPWTGTAARYPRYRSRSGTEEALPQRINDCIQRSLAGRALDEDSRDMRDMAAYIESLRNTPRAAGPDTIRLAGNAVAGGPVFAARCARCHGANGNGGVMPAVAGIDSYSIGAGMARQKMLSTFAHANMPLDSAGVLSAQESADVAAYVLSLARQDYPGKEADWPKGDPPADVAYATAAARAAGKPVPAARPLLPRRLAIDAAPLTGPRHE